MQISDPDARLMLAFREGDAAALSELYRRWAGPLLRFLTRMVREQGLAEELMQETFIRVHGARDRYVADARFSTWLFRIGRNLALNELDRSRNKSLHVSTDATETDESTRPKLSLVSGEAPVDEVVESRRRAKRVEAELAELPERQRTALWLAAVEGYAYAEIAEVLETTPKSVKALVHRARANLADRMTESTTQDGENGVAVNGAGGEGAQ